MQSSARVGSVLQGGLGRRPAAQQRGRTPARPQAQASLLRQTGGVLDAVIQGYVSDGVITREEAASMSADQLEFLIRKRTRSSPEPPEAYGAPAPPPPGPPSQAAIQAYLDQGVITSQEATTMSSTQLEFLIRKRSRQDGGVPVSAPGASSAVPYRPGVSPSRPPQPIASTPVSGGIAGGLGVNEAELSPEQLELLQEYIRIKEQEEMLQQQEALLQQQVASLKNEVEELEGTTVSKAQQGQSVFRDAPPLRDASPGPFSGVMGAAARLQQGAAAAAKPAEASTEGAAPNGWAAAAAAGVALVGLSAGLYFSSDNLFKPKPATSPMQQPAPPTAPMEAARLVDRPAAEPTAAELKADIKGAEEAKAVAEANVAAQSKAAEVASAAQAKASAEAKAAEETKVAAEANAALQSQKVAAAKASSDSNAVAQAKAAELKAGAEARAATEAKAAAETKAAGEAKKVAEARAAEAKAAAQAKAAEGARQAAEEAKKAAEVKAAAEAKAVVEAKKAVEVKAAADAKAAAEAKAVEEARKAAAAKVATLSAAAVPEVREEVKIASGLAKSLSEKQVAPVAAPNVAPKTEESRRGFFGRRADDTKATAASPAVAATAAAKSTTGPAVAPLAMSSEAQALKSKMRGEPAGAVAAVTPESSSRFGFGAETATFLAAGTALAAALAIRAGTRAPANLIRTAEGRVSSLKETLEVQQADLRAAQEKVVVAQAEYARGLASLRSANSELQSLSSRVLSSEKTANALVADLAKLGKGKDDKVAARLRTEAAALASQVTKQRELVSAQVAKQRQVVEAALQKALSEVSA